MTAPAPTPPRTYDESLLTVLDPQNRDFARTFVRSLLRDRPEIDRGGVPLGPGQPTRPRDPTWPEWSRTDLELNAALELDAVLDTSVTPLAKHYRPHFTAARLYLGDPNIWKSRAVDGSSESRRDSGEIVRAWLLQGAALDRMIPAHLWPLPDFEGEGKAGSAVVDEPYVTAIPITVTGL